VLRKYGYFKAQFDRMLADIGRTKPDALLLIDYPGFNLRLAKAVRSRHPEIRIIYYISPQVWAWNRGRIPRMAQFVDLMLCIFPFEKPLYEASGLRAEFVGHPMLDSLAKKKLELTRESDLVALLPGSRAKEVRKIFPTMLAAADVMRERLPSLRFAASAASDTLATEMRALAGERCVVTTGNAHELMQRAGAGMVCSGTATLEAAYFGLPMTILYRVAWLTWVVGKRLVRVPFLGMPNILAEKEIVPEFLQDAAQPEPIAAAVLELLSNPATRERQQAELRRVIEKLGEPDAGARAAKLVLQAIPA
jgi:lipid-A-disaccharide synthase